MKNSKSPFARKIWIVAWIATGITTFSAVRFYLMLFFFIGFFNPVLFIGTAPILLLMLCVEAGKRKHVVIGWLVGSIIIMAISTLIGFMFFLPW